MTSAGGAVTVLLSLMALLSIACDRTMGYWPKLAWAFVVVILPIIGPVLWFVVGKRYPYRPSGGNR